MANGRISFAVYDMEMIPDEGVQKQIPELFVYSNDMLP